MKKFYFVLFLIPILLSFTTSCKKDAEQVGEVTFYTTSPDNWSLIVDGKEYGKIKNTSQMPVCKDPDFQTLKLEPGTHTADAKSLDGFAWGNPKTFTVISGECIQVKLP
jgi:hypothetical protein